uniref:Uncharacterized protein n=1 Tax=Ananas comosus var. bracteatus TaxID=296719 RepID=A0A6V7PLK3_ANACO|nr:unnamed protein product [Ananas comosus var. bracteatus]
MGRKQYCGSSSSESPTEEVVRGGGGEEISIFIRSPNEGTDGEEEEEEEEEEVDEWRTRVEKRLEVVKKYAMKMACPKRKGLPVDMYNDEEIPAISEMHIEHRPVKAVAIGPYHRGDKVLFTNVDKWRVVRIIAKWYAIDPMGYLTRMKEKEADARMYYSADLSEFNSESFLELLLVDACFILFVISTFEDYADGSWSKGEDGTEYLNLLMDVKVNAKQIKLDLLMLENQIPFFAIEELLKASTNQANFEKNLIESQALLFFDDIYPRRDRDKGIRDADSPRFHHLLHLFHWSRVPRGKYEFGAASLLFRRTDLTLGIPSATELRQSATRFRKEASGSFLDITFENCGVMKVCGVVKIPTLHILDYSSTIFHNLVAFEKQYKGSGRCVVAYSACMAHLLQSKEDVKLLRKSGILANTNVNDIDAVNLFASLSEEIGGSLMPDDLHALYSQVTKHHRQWRSRWYGETTLQYCPNLWITISVIGALLLFLLTAVQTVYSVLSYYASLKNK